MLNLDTKKKKMVRSAVFYGNGQIKHKEFEKPVIAQGEILVKVNLCTLCQSDLHTFTGLRQEATPTILGHEIVGTIKKVNGDVKDIYGKQLKPKDKIIWSIFASPEDDPMALKGMRQKASNLYKYGHQQITDEDHCSGGLSSHIVLKPGTCIAKIPKRIGDEILAPVGCSLATMVGAFRLGGSIEHKRIAIIGAGMLGIHGLAYARVRSPLELVSIDKDPSRLDMAIKFGADQTFLSRSDTSYPELNERFDLIIDTSGSIEAMEKSISMLNIGGTAVWLGAVFPQKESVRINPEVVIRKLISIKGLHNYNEVDFANAADHIISHHDQFPYPQLVEQVFEIEETEKAFFYALKNTPFRVGVRST